MKKLLLLNLGLAAACAVALHEVFRRLRLADALGQQSTLAIQGLLHGDEDIRRRLTAIEIRDLQSNSGQRIALLERNTSNADKRLALLEKRAKKR